MVDVASFFIFSQACSHSIHALPFPNINLPHTRMLAFPNTGAPPRWSAKAISEFSIESDMRMDVYSAVKAFADTAEAKALKGEQARYLERVLRDYNRDGMHLDKATRGK